MSKLDKNELISVIVPVYNVEKYIEKCIKSIVNQTYRNIEVIIVNDGTKDNSIEVIREYLKSDNRIKLINQKNSGLSCARNTGINNSMGNFIIFIDSDDFINENMIEKMYFRIKQDNSDMVICNVKKWDFKNDVELPFTENYFSKKRLLSKEEAIKELLLNNLNGYSWNKMYKKDLFKDIRFLEGRLFEDIFTTFDTINLCEKISILEEKLYYYVFREGSITRNISKKSIIDLNYRIEYIGEKIDKKLYKNEYTFLKLKYYLYSIDWISKYKYENKIKKLDEDLINIIKQKKDFISMNIFTNNFISKTDKLKYILLRINILKSIYFLKNKFNRN